MLLLDNSAWSRVVAGLVDPERAAIVTAWLKERRLGTCLPFLLEAGYSVRSSTDHQALMSDLARLPRMHASHEAEKHALQAQHELAAAGHHRLDVMMAACAHEAGAGCCTTTPTTT